MKLSLYLINYAPRYEDEWESGGVAPPSLTSALDGDEWSASRPGCFTPWEAAPGTHWIGGLVRPKPGLGAMECGGLVRVLVK
jgi:hypothetical protein